MKNISIIAIAFVLASCSSAPPGMPQEKTVDSVYVPAIPKAPDISEVEKTVRDLSEEVGDARDEVRAASDKVAEGVKESVLLRELIEKEYNAAEVTAQTALENIRYAAGRTETKLNDTVGLLEAASSKLMAANSRSNDLSSKISALKSEIAVQSSRVDEFAAMAESANGQVVRANAQKDSFRNALSSAEGEKIALMRERDKARTHRMWLSVTIVILILALFISIKF
jgi:chromosome segregation ATPase